MCMLLECTCTCTVYIHFTLEGIYICTVEGLMSLLYYNVYIYIYIYTCACY